MATTEPSRRFDLQRTLRTESRAAHARCAANKRAIGAIIALCLAINAASSQAALQEELLSFSDPATFGPLVTSVFTGTGSQGVTGWVVNGGITGGDIIFGDIDFSQNWSSSFTAGVSSFGLLMNISAPNNNIPFSLEFLDSSSASIDIWSAVTGTTAFSGYIHFGLVPSSPGSGNYSDVKQVILTWANAQPAQINATISKVSVFGGSFTALAPGGVRFITAPFGDSGVRLTAGATDWSSLSDSNAKTGITAVDHRRILREVAALPVTAWNYKHDPDRRYIGPMAQDFRRTFGLGFDDEHISTLDTDGVALSALKGLIEELRERKARSAEQARRLAELEAELRALSHKLRGRLPGAE